MTEKTVARKNLGWVVIFFAFVIIAIVLVFLLRGNETRVSNNNGNTAIKSLYCNTENPVQPFFDYAGGAAKHEIKYTFNSDEKIDKVSYTYSNDFTSNEAAVQAEAQLHADYNIYMGKTDIYQEDLTPTFIINGNNLMISLFMNRNTFTPETAVLAFLTREEFDDIGGYGINDVKRIYESKDFSCNIK